MAKLLATTGNAACAQAMRQIDPDVVAVYPITPQTAIVEEFSTFAANGKVHTEFINVESEHSALSACVGASAAGARVMTATSSQGLALMWEILYIASALRLPIVMHNVNRALSGPINIHCDHSDSMGARDAGWIQLFSENAQEAYDNTIQAVKIAEDERVRLPVMVLLDGFIISHAIDRIEMLDDEVVKKFVGEYRPLYPLLDVDSAVTAGAFFMHTYYFEQKRAQQEVIENSAPVILEAGNAYEAISGRPQSFFEEYMLDDAETAVVVLGSTAGTARVVIDKLRSQGIPVGMLKLRLFRPFPAEELKKSLGKAKAIGVMDRSASFGALGGPVFTELRSALYELNPKPQIVNYIYGLGGRDTTVEEIERAIRELGKVAESGKVKKLINYLGVRE
jgi:pyruvate ferredoxin oxidoreductase alpha subunit